MAGDILVFGRIDRGERFASGLLHDEWAVRVDSRLVWTDNLHLHGDVESVLASSSGFGGSRCMAIFLYIGADALSYLDRARSLIVTEGLTDVSRFVFECQEPHSVS